MRDFMIIKRYRTHIALLIIAAFQFVYGQFGNTQTITKTGTTAASFLKIGVDARGTGMGNAFVAMEGDVSSIYWNPAGLTNVKSVQSKYINCQWLAGIQINYLSVALNLGKMGITGLAITSLQVPDDIIRTVSQPEGTGERFNAADLAVVLAYSRHLTDKFSIGSNVKYISERIWHSSARSVAF